jgi:PTS system mannose-specific IIA component
MIGGLIVTHGRLAIELLNAAEQIIGEVHHVAAVSLGWHDDVDTAAGLIAKAIDRVKTPEGVLILTDMFGGTPTNIASTYLDPGKVEIITGVNLPMLIKFLQLGDGKSLASAAKLIRENGQNSIYIASELLSPKKQP